MWRMTGREGEGGGGGKYDGECLFDDDPDNNEYDDNDKYDDAEDGKGSCRGVDNGGESDYDGHDVVCGPSIGGVGRRTLIVGPHAAIVDDNNDDNCRHGGGALCPPPSGPSRPAGCLSLLLMSPTTVNGGSTRAFGAWSYVWCWRRRRLAPLNSFVRFQSTPGWTIWGRGAA